MDRTGADFERTVGMIEDRLHAVPLVVQLPWGVEGGFHGVIDLVEMRGHYWPSEGLDEEWEDRDIPDEYRAAAEEWHHKLFEQLADHDEELMEKFVHEEEPSVDEMRERCAGPRSTRRATGCSRRCAARPSEQGRAAAARRHREHLLAAGRARHPRTEPKTGEQVARTRARRPFAALAFKIMSDPTSAG